MGRDRILLIGDDKEVRKGVKIFLKSQGYVVSRAADGMEGLKVLEDNEIDLVIMDVMMPRMDGTTMTTKFREKHDFPVILLSAKSEEVDKTPGLNMGADDYVTRPFTPMRPLTRVNSRLRRYHRSMGRLNSRQAENPKIYGLGELEVNEGTVEIMADGSCMKVTSIEFKILLLLIQNPGRVFPVEEIYERVQNKRVINMNMAMVHIRNLRGKIKVDPRELKYVEVIWGVRYKIEKRP